MGFFNDEVNKELDRSGSSYMSFEQGANTIRIISEFAWGYEYDYANREEGEEKGRPFYRTNSPEISAVRSKLVLKANMVVWDYSAKELKVLSLHQKNILNAIRDYVENEKFGAPTGYDLVVTKRGDGRDTRYGVVANPPEAIGEEIQNALMGVTINLENFYNGQNPIVER